MNAEPRPVRRTSRRIGMGLAIASTALIATGCAAGKQAATANEQNTIDGTNADLGKIALRALAIEAPTTGSYAAGSDVILIGTISNDGLRGDTLTSISTKAASGWGRFTTASDARAVIASDEAGATGASSASSAAPLPIATQSVPLPAGEHVAFGTPVNNGALILTNLTGALYPAQTVAITFTFAKAGSLTVRVPVQITAARHNLVIPVVSDSAPGE